MKASVCVWRGGGSSGDAEEGRHDRELQRERGIRVWWMSSDGIGPMEKATTLKLGMRGVSVRKQQGNFL